jgi:hypothetical protein
MNEVPYVVFEGIEARHERTVRRLWILCLVIFAALVITNSAWVYYESSFEDLVVTQENDDGFNNYIGNDGDITN